MSDRINGLTVVLDKDYRDDDVQRIIDAIAMVKGVQQVVPHIVNGNDVILRMQIKNDLQRRMYNAVTHIFNDKEV